MVEPTIIITPINEDIPISEEETFAYKQRIQDKLDFPQDDVFARNEYITVFLLQTRKTNLNEVYLIKNCGTQ